MLSRVLILLFFVHVSASQADEVDSKNWYLVGESAIAINTNTLESELERFLETQPKDLLLPLNEYTCLLYTSPSPRDRQKSRMPSSA